MVPANFPKLGDHMARNHSNLRFIYLFVGAVLCIGGSLFVWLLIKGLEGKAPTIEWETSFGSVGRTYTFQGVATDRESGLKRLWIALMQQGKEVVLFDQTFPSEGLLRRGAIQRYPISLEIDTTALGLIDGEAMLRTACWDYSYSGWLSGNRFYAEHKVVFDTRPPAVEMVTHIHNLNQGGAGLAVYRVSEPVASSGVQVVDRFFPGLKGYFGETDVFLAFFALPFDKGPETRLSVTATDVAGNIGSTGFPYHVNAKTFKTDTISISDGFLRQKMPEFEGITGVGNQASPLETFLKVNRDLRQANYETIRKICNTSDPVKHWDGVFLRLPASARKAGFAEHRTYKYKGKAVDQQFHLGVDLAATSSFPVPSANGGRIVFADDLGIYGRTVIVDHGFFFFSMYSHLSRIQAVQDQMVSKGDIIGFTGRTGLAGGDHLHFGILIHDTFVNPIEWWDSTWIKHNITDKLMAAAERIGTN
jgi:hypothetical protein